MNNLGCIYLKKDQFQNSMEFLNNAIRIQNQIIKNQNKELAEKDMKRFLFVNGCRQYNKGLSC